jgi:MoaA/NifB/PqqE/SkfB family radical SAM enzyme
MLSAGYKFVANGDGFNVRPCCLFPSDHFVKTKQDLDSWRKTINEVDSYSNPNCNDCNFLESTKVRNSRRELAFRIIPESASVGDPSFIELQLDTTCNGGCIICGPQLSSYWSQELGIQAPKKKIDYFDSLTKLVDFNKANYIVLLGGEPFLTDIDEKLEKVIIDPSKVTLQYTTNGSIFPTDERMKIWEKFKNVLINVSIDGIGDRFEYIRYPLKWDKVEQNFIKMVKIFPDNVKIKINHSVNILNLYYFDEFSNWFEQNFSSSPRVIPYTPFPVHGTLSPRTVTQRYKDKLLEKYSVTEIPIRMIETVQNNTQPILGQLRVLDSRRNQNWQLIFPEIVDPLRSIV